MQRPSLWCQPQPQRFLCFDQVEHAWLDLGERDHTKLLKLSNDLNGAEPRVRQTNALVFPSTVVYTPTCHTQENAPERLAKFIETLGEDQGRLKGVGVQKGTRIKTARGVSQGSCVSME